MLMLRRWLITLCMVLAVPCQADEARYAVSYVYDGDTVKLHPVQHFTHAYDLKLRLSQIDAPERTQAYGVKARRALIQLCQAPNVEVTVEFHGQDAYQRQLGNLHCNQADASAYLVEQGLAWHNQKYSDDAYLKHAQQKAQDEQLGLWAQAHPTPPWVWRKLNKSPTH